MERTKMDRPRNGSKVDSNSGSEASRYMHLDNVELQFDSNKYFRTEVKNNVR